MMLKLIRFYNWSQVALLVESGLQGQSSTLNSYQTIFNGTAIFFPFLNKLLAHHITINLVEMLDSAANASWTGYFDSLCARLKAKARSE